MRRPEDLVPGAIELDIDAMNLEGDGVGRYGRETIVVPFTIPGERVRVERRRGATPREATLVEILRPSPHRVAPPCPHFGANTSTPCGGCSWQHIAYDEQLRLKTALVDRLIKAAVPGAPSAQPMLAPLPSPWGYRHKVHFAFGPGPARAPLVMGHYARGSRRLVAVREC